MVILYRWHQWRSGIKGGQIRRKGIGLTMLCEQLPHAFRREKRIFLQH